MSADLVEIADAADALTGALRDVERVLRALYRVQALTPLQLPIDDADRARELPEAGMALAYGKFEGTWGIYLLNAGASEALWSQRLVVRLAAAEHVPLLAIKLERIHRGRIDRVSRVVECLFDFAEHLTHENGEDLASVFFRELERT